MSLVETIHPIADTIEKKSIAETKMHCRICGLNNSNYIFSKLVLNKYDVSYYKCSDCGFIQTEKPYWLKEAYSNVIANLDIGLIYRTINIYPLISFLIDFLFRKKEKKYIDYGGGYGIFTRVMRDNGYDYYNYDPYCENIFSRDFNVEKSGTSRFELLTAFEVFEHLEFPMEEVKKMLEYSDSILFSTELQPKEKVEDWWYLVPETGQHISLYTQLSLETLAKKIGCYFYTNGGIHLISKRKINGFLFKVISHHRLHRILKVFIVYKKSSLLSKDFERLRNESFV